MQEFIYNVAIGLPAFLFAIVAHEWAHAFIAYKFGDTTAKDEGRLSFNPIVHADPLGTLMFPLIGAVTGGIMFGWAKPVPVRPSNFKNQRVGVFWVSFAGPGMNLLLGTLSAFLLAVVATKVDPNYYLTASFISILKSSVFINFILAFFNLIPLPPLDGGQMLGSFLSYNNLRKFEQLGQYSFVILLALLFTGMISVLLKPALYLSNFLITSFFQMLV